MSVFLVSSIQAASGKTTIAMHLAEGLRRQASTALLLIDDTEQGFEWVAAEQPDFSFEYCNTHQMTNAEIEQRLKPLQQNFTHVVIDMSGHDTPLLRSILKTTDKLLIPTTSGQQDLAHVAEMLELAISFKPYQPQLQLFIVFNRIPAQTTLEQLDIGRELLADVPYAHFLNTIIYQDDLFEQRFNDQKNIWQKMSLTHKVMDAFVAEVLAH